MDRSHPTLKPSGPRLSLHGGHSSFGDGAGRLEEFAAAAWAQQLIAFGFSEHMPRPERYWYPGETPEKNSRDNFRRYLEEARRIQEKFRGKVDILVGAELELIPGLENFLRDFVAEFALDYAVGSVHFVAGIGFDFSAEFYAGAIAAAGGQEAFCLAYLDTVAQMIEAIPFQVLGHFDLFKVFSRTPPRLTEAMRARIDRLMARIAACGILLDINARGLVKPCREIYPSLEILRIARKHQAPLTLGDDSHAPGEVGKNLDLAVEHVRQAGYTRIGFLRAYGSRAEVDC